MSFNYVPANPTHQTVAFHQAPPGTTLALGFPQGQNDQNASQCQPITAPMAGPMPVTYVQMPTTNLGPTNNVGVINTGQPMIFHTEKNKGKFTVLTKRNHRQSISHKTISH